MLWLDLANYLDCRARLERERDELRFMPMADGKEIDKVVRRINEEIQSLEAWFNGGKGSANRFRDWRRRRRGGVA